MKALPRIGFVGVGWIGRNRMEALARSGEAAIVAIADTSIEMCESARSLSPDACVVDDLRRMLELDLDGVVIATPSAMHAEHCRAALHRGLHVFCQKPLGRTEAETLDIVELAKRKNLRLGVDFSYRFTNALSAMRSVMRTGALGKVFALDLVFHNAYGPDKAWFYDPALSGGGCVMDLGIHLADAALWLLDFPEVTHVSSRLFKTGTLLGSDPEVVEDYATAELDLSTGVHVRLACSWNLPAGQDAIIAMHAFGTDGGVCFRNVGGSFYDFEAERFRGTQRSPLVSPPDSWGGRALVDWVRKLRGNRGFDDSAYEAVSVARVLDRIYGRPGARTSPKMDSNSAFPS